MILFDWGSAETGVFLMGKSFYPNLMFISCVRSHLSK